MIERQVERSESSQHPRRSPTYAEQRLRPHRPRDGLHTLDGTGGNNFRRDLMVFRSPLDGAVSNLPRRMGLQPIRPPLGPPDIPAAHPRWARSTAMGYNCSYTGDGELAGAVLLPQTT
jgi:hypothetical protein